MTTKLIAGWTLETWPLASLPRHRPVLSGPASLTASVDDEGRLVVDGGGRARCQVSAPLVAISALMEAHQEWMAAKAFTDPIEKVDAELRASGADPVEIGKRGAALVKQFIKQRAERK